MRYSFYVLSLCLSMLCFLVCSRDVSYTTDLSASLSHTRAYPTHASRPTHAQAHACILHSRQVSPNFMVSAQCRLFGGSPCLQQPCTVAYTLYISTYSSWSLNTRHAVHTRRTHPAFLSVARAYPTHTQGRRIHLCTHNTHAHTNTRTHSYNLRSRQVPPNPVVFSRPIV
jgi:hypothetical protein